MSDMQDANTPRKRGAIRDSAAEYLRRAVDACDGGDTGLGTHLYLAAFEEDVADNSLVPSPEALGGLKQAWTLACASKERSLAEYIFGKMEPYLSAEELAICAEELQKLAMDRLEEFGLSRDELEDMAETISRDLLGVDAPVIKVEHVITGKAVDGKGDMAAGLKNLFAAVADVPANPRSCASPSADEREQADDGREDAAPSAELVERKPDQNGKETLASALSALKSLGFPGFGADGRPAGAEEEKLSYANLAGYDSVVALMRDMGVGLQDDAEFRALVEMLNARHGLSQMPALDTLLFRATAREDAARFVAATIGELGLPVMRMSMEEGFQGAPLLCVTVHADNEPKLNTLRNAFEGGGVLVLEDIDLWSAPFADMPEEQGSFLMMQLSRGAREAVSLIRSAVDNPEVYVLATASNATEIDPFFLDMLEPMSFVDIDYPTPEERVDIWMDIARDHPSMRGVKCADLVRLSANMPRFDIYMAAREALEEAYKVGLQMRRYQPVTRENLFDKLAAYQSLESREYSELEEAVVSNFRADLEHLEDMLESE